VPNSGAPAAPPLLIKAATRAYLYRDNNRPVFESIAGSLRADLVVYQAGIREFCTVADMV